MTWCLEMVEMQSKRGRLDGSVSRALSFCIVMSERKEFRKVLNRNRSRKRCRAFGFAYVHHAMDKEFLESFDMSKMTTEIIVID